MTTSFKTRLRRSFTAGCLAATLAASAGCQTFSLTDEEFQMQQRGEMVDPDTGKVVDVVGTVGLFGAAIAAAVAAKK